jgi:hypothetical protein
MKSKLQIAIVFVTVLGIFMFSNNSALAWWSFPPNPTHPMMTMLSAGPLREAGLYDPEALYKGSIDPDDKGLFQKMTHEHSWHVKESFLAAVKECAKKEKVDTPKSINEKRHWVIRRLARSFHYLQDTIDVTDGLSSHKDRVRSLANQLLRDGSFRSDTQWVKLVKKEYEIFSQHDIEGIQRILEKICLTEKEAIKKIYGRQKSNTDMKDRQVKMRLKRIFALIAACQNRVIVLLKEQCDLQRTVEMDMEGTLEASDRIGGNNLCGCPVSPPKEAIRVVDSKHEFWRMPNGKPVGAYKAWFDIGKSNIYKCICYDTDGKMHGPRTVWHREGSKDKPDEYYEYKHGVKDGKFRRYRKNGSRIDHGFYRNGKRWGLYRSYWANDKPMRQAEYVNDKETGNVSEFNSNGIITFQQKGRLENGKLTGQKCFFNKDPGRIWIEEYVNSRLIKSYWDIKKQEQTHP